MAYNPEQVEPLYLIAEYIAANVFGSVHFALFVYSFVTNLFAYFAIKNLKDKLNVTIGWIAYCLLFYSVTLNLMRQSIAVIIIFFIFSDAKRISCKRVALLTLLAMGFHISGFMGIFLYLVYRIFEISDKSRYIIKEVSVVVFSLVPFLYDVILAILVKINILSGKYLIYIDTKGGLSLGNMLFRGLGVFIYSLYLYKRKSHKDDAWNQFILYIAVMDILFLINNGLFSYRIGKIFSVFEIIYYTIGIDIFKPKIFASIAIISIMFVYWIYQFVILNSGEIYPYTIDTTLFKLF